MHEFGVAIGDKPRDEPFKIASDGRVGILAHDQRGARVLDEEMAEPDPNSRVRDDLSHLIGDFDRPSATGRDCELLAVDHVQGSEFSFCRMATKRQLTKCGLQIRFN
jgi:hypothetical protein